MSKEQELADRVAVLERQCNILLSILESLEGHVGGDDDFLPGERKRIAEATEALGKARWS